MIGIDALIKNWYKANLFIDTVMKKTRKKVFIGVNERQEHQNPEKLVKGRAIPYR